MIFFSYMMNGKRGRVDVGQPPDLVPGLLPVLVLQIPGKVLENEPVHRFTVSKTRFLER